jgi:hypothetical protein
MAESITILSYNGHVDYKKIDLLLKNLRRHKDYISLGKTVAKRLYAITVECLENIAKHSEDLSPGAHGMQPSILIKRQNGFLTVITGNPVSISITDELRNSLDHINSLDEEKLLKLYDNQINNGSEPGKKNCAGLGFMLMKLKSRNNIGYSFRGDEQIVWFELTITIKQYIMRKLVIDQTSYSPKVILDPDRNRYEISGESRPPDVAGFYSDILSWFEDYSHYLLRSDENEPVVFNLDFEYFNSSSAKYILDFCKKIAGVRSGGRDIIVKWHYEDDDIDMLETGREMSKMAKFPFEYVVKEK